MSWQLSAFAIVFASLGAAFWWYERSHPPAKLVALIAALAALAALGRDAFAAVPDVKPITAIVLVAGVAFGAAPGFAVGALAALASNLLLGEGPWTPWQMLGWGLVGVLGAGIGAVWGRRLPALAIALACAVGAELFNLLLDGYTWTNTGAHTLAGFGVVLGTALTFDLTHVVASFAFGLAFGAALLRMLLRMRSRLHVSWVPLGPEGTAAPAVAAAAAPAAAPPPNGASSAQGGAPAGEGSGRVSSRTVAAGVALAAALVALHAVPLAAPPGARAAGGSAAGAPLQRAVTYLLRAQNSDGGFGAAPGSASAELYSAWAAIGLAAAGRRPSGVRRGGRSVLDALRSQAGSLQGAGDLERTILALHASGASADSLPGFRPVERLLSYRKPDGSFSHLANLTAFAILALRAAGRPAGSPTVRSAARWLARQQERDGGFGFAAGGSGGGGSDVDDTGATLQALAAAGVHGTTLTRAVAYLTRPQNLDGGFPQQPGEASNAQSTAWAVQGLLAAGHDVARTRRSGSPSPLGYLESLIGPDGSVRYSRASPQTPVWVTAQVLPALAGKPLPVAPPPAGPASSVSSPHSQAAAGASARARLASRSRSLAGTGSGVAGTARERRTLAAARTAGALIAVILSPVVGPAR
jgi:energy-coupling factor transport system substrate-specific component